jgi:hypothetical protein
MGESYECGATLWVASITQRVIVDVNFRDEVDRVVLCGAILLGPVAAWMASRDGLMGQFAETF